MKDVTIRAVTGLQSWVLALRHRTEGATAAEYALLVALIAVAIIAAVQFLGGTITGVFNRTGSTLSNATS